MSAAPLRIGVAGLGTVGAGLVRLLQTNAEVVAAAEAPAAAELARA